MPAALMFVVLFRIAHLQEEPFWWFEVYDMVRRIILIGLIVFAMPGTRSTHRQICSWHSHGMSLLAWSLSV
jgi:hypothetical protein